MLVKSPGRGHNIPNGAEPRRARAPLAETCMFTHKFKDCYSLAELPWFKINDAGRLVLAEPEKVGPIIDFHSHLGFAIFFSPPLDLRRRAPETLHNFPMRGVEVDLDLESGLNLELNQPGRVVRQYIQSMFTNKGDQATHTVPNIKEEMADMNIERAIVMAIDFPFGAQNSEAYLDAMRGEDSLVPFVAINPLRPGWEERMDRHIANGARGLKVHPYSEFMTSDHPFVIRMLRRWERSGLPVLFHTAFNSIAPGFLQLLARMETYEKALRRFPNIKFVLGHAGMDFFETAIEYANKYDNVYLEIDGQPPANLERICDSVDHSRLLFGTDWPFFPMALALAKVFIGVHGDESLTRKLLYKNAAELLGSSQPASASASA